MDSKLLARTPLVRLLWRPPPLLLTEEKRAAFERGDLESYPKHEYLRWLVGERAVLLHGTAQRLHVFEPREQTDWDGRPVCAVFASSDGIWPIFFAIVNRAAVHSVRNGCLVYRGGSYYWFSVGGDPAAESTWQDGFVYVLPRDPFRPHALGTEWTSPEPIRPLDRIPVAPRDFPFLDRVIRHRRSESIVQTLLKAIRA